MKKILPLLLLWSAVFTTVRARNSDDSVKSLLWKISGKDMKHASYLFGTIHLICPEDYFWTGAMEDALNEVPEVCFEMDMDDPELMTSIAKGMLNTSGKDLKDYFTSEQYAKLEKYLLDSFQMNLYMFNQLKPVALQTIFTSKIANCSEPLTYENTIMEKAKEKNIEVTGLEAPEEQIAVLDSIPTDSVVVALMDMIGKDNDGTAEYKEMVTAYKKQDIQQLHTIMQTATESGLNLDIFLDQRNEKWTQRMIDKMDQQAVFFAVGAGHLPGPKGMISLLREQGYDVEPVK